MKRIIKHCKFSHGLNDLEGNFLKALRVECIIAQTTFQGEEPQYDYNITSIKDGDYDLYPVLKALTADFQIKQTLDKTAKYIFGRSKEAASQVNF